MAKQKKRSKRSEQDRADRDARWSRLRALIEPRGAENPITMEDLQADEALAKLWGAGDDEQLNKDLEKLKKNRSQEEEEKHPGFRIWEVPGVGYVNHSHMPEAKRIKKQKKDDEKKASEAAREKEKTKRDELLTGIIRATFEKQPGTAMAPSVLKAAAHRSTGARDRPADPEAVVLSEVDDRDINRLLKDLCAVNVNSKTQWLLNGKHKQIWEGIIDAKVVGILILDGRIMEPTLQTFIATRLNSDASAIEIGESLNRLKAKPDDDDMKVVDQPRTGYILKRGVALKNEALKKAIVKLVRSRWNNEVSIRHARAWPLTDGSAD